MDRDLNAAKVLVNQAVGYTVLACGLRRTGRATCGRVLKSVAADCSQLLQEVNLNVSYYVALYQFYVAD